MAGRLDGVTAVDQVVVVHGEEELFRRAGHLFAAATVEIACAADTVRTWGTGGSVGAALAATAERIRAGLVVRKLYQPPVLLDPTSAERARLSAASGASVRVTSAELPETILLDQRVAILAGDLERGVRTFSVVRAPDVVAGVLALYDAAWRSARELAVADAALATLRSFTPRILDALGAGWTDETAARALGMSVRTYRRRVAELMSALGATSRFQAGARARELGLV
jgi:DNA-binding NarL/FixJ family response regulator